MNENDQRIILPEEYHSLRVKYADLIKSNDVIRARNAEMEDRIKEWGVRCDDLVRRCDDLIGRNAELEELTRQPACLTTTDELKIARDEQRRAEGKANAFERIAQGYEMLWKASIF